jgi:hypothetical protein
VFARISTWAMVGLYIRFSNRFTCSIVYVINWLCCFCQWNCMFILLASFNNLGLVIYQVYVQAHALIGAKMTYQLKRKNCCIYLCLVKYMSVCQLIHRYLAREHFFKGSEGKNKEKNPRAQSRIQVNQTWRPLLKNVQPAKCCLALH